MRLERAPVEPHKRACMAHGCIQGRLHARNLTTLNIYVQHARLEAAEPCEACLRGRAAAGKGGEGGLEQRQGAAVHAERRHERDVGPGCGDTRAVPARHVIDDGLHSGGGLGGEHYRHKPVVLHNMCPAQHVSCTICVLHNMRGHLAQLELVDALRAACVYLWEVRVIGDGIQTLQVVYPFDEIGPVQSELSRAW